MKLAILISIFIIAITFIGCATNKTTGHSVYTKVFEDIDSDNDGYLSSEELIDAYPRHGHKIDKSADRDNDGKISKEEYRIITQ